MLYVFKLSALGVALADRTSASEVEGADLVEVEEINILVLFGPADGEEGCGETICLLEFILQGLELCTQLFFTHILDTLHGLAPGCICRPSAGC